MKYLLALVLVGGGIFWLLGGKTEPGTSRLTRFGSTETLADSLNSNNPAASVASFTASKNATNPDIIPAASSNSVKRLANAPAAAKREVPATKLIKKYEPNNVAATPAAVPGSSYRKNSRTTVDKHGIEYETEVAAATKSVTPDICLKVSANERTRTISVGSTQKPKAKQIKLEAGRVYTEKEANDIAFEYAINNDLSSKRARELLFTQTLRVDHFVYSVRSDLSASNGKNVFAMTGKKKI